MSDHQPPLDPPSASGATTPVGRGRMAALGAAAAVVLVGVVVVLLVVLRGGGGPAGVVEDYYRSFQEGDCRQRAEALSNQNVGARGEAYRDDAIDDIVATCEDDADDGDPLFSGCDIDTGDVEERADTATVQVELSGCDDADRDMEAEATVVRENDEWRLEAPR